MGQYVMRCQAEMNTTRLANRMRSAKPPTMMAAVVWESECVADGALADLNAGAYR